MMKKLNFLFLILFATANIYSQNYDISFVATGAATTVDSVKVENLTQGTSLTLLGTDTLHLGNVGINEVGVNNENLQVYPNPMQGRAELAFYAKQDGNAKIVIYDISGKEILQAEDKLIQGTQKYQLTGLKQGVYFINISGTNYFYTTKLISQNVTPSEAKIKYIGSEKPEALISRLKSTKVIVNMPYVIGNSLRFTGYSDTYYAIMIDVPSVSKTITFTYGGTTCNNFTVTHTADSVAPVTKTVTYGTVSTTLFGGTKCAITQNLGASMQATSASDTSETSAGWYWQYNRKQGYKHDGTTRTPNTTWINSINENSDWTTVNDPCNLLLGAGWRLPTYTEWYNADNNSNWVNYNDTYASALKINATGYLRGSDGSLGGRGADGFYWSNMQFNATFGNFLKLRATGCGMLSDSKSYGFSVRCIRD